MIIYILLFLLLYTIIIIDNDNDKEVLNMNTDFSGLNNIDWQAILTLALPIMALTFILMLISLFDWFKRKNIIEYPYLWLIVILLIQTIGPILYLIVGRRMVKHD